MTACATGKLGLVNSLLKLNTFDINKTNEDGKTALMFATSKGHVEVVKQLLQVGANANKADDYGQRPLHRAAGKGGVEMVQLLVETGKADVNVQDKNGDTPLHCAAMENNEQVGKFLLNNGADDGIKNKDGKTYEQVHSSGPV
eukprot:TRINITY_DN59445_c0_g1_i1.p2 TRINITY_DN59445_c0_g1~~TRINITY_DN59445_c0_g1_i1.p2  ORF type:complete len:143 (+),score=25.62 TRINITY_DN59445_c0_g1_i1:320-748(+)